MTHLKIADFSCFVEWTKVDQVWERYGAMTRALQICFRFY